MLHFLLVVLALGVFGIVSARAIELAWPVLRVVLGGAAVLGGALLVGWLLTH